MVAQIDPNQLIVRQLTRTVALEQIALIIWSSPGGEAGLRSGTCYPSNGIDRNCRRAQTRDRVIRRARSAWDGPESRREGRLRLS
jgi:hypothetical protein